MTSGEDSLRQAKTLEALQAGYASLLASAPDPDELRALRAAFLERRRGLTGDAPPSAAWPATRSPKLPRDEPSACRAWAVWGVMVLITFILIRTVGPLLGWWD